MRLLIVIVLFLFSSLAVAGGGLQFIDPWVRQAPPAAKMLAAYGELKNNGSADVHIVAISSELFDNVQMHTTRFDRGMMKMSESKELALKPGQSIVFAPNSHHLMLFRPAVAIKPGVMVPIRFKLTTGRVVRFVLPVKR